MAQQPSQTSTQQLPKGVKSIPEDVAPLFTPLKLGRYELTNRLVYPPLTRCRATDSVPQPIMADYYAQRAFPGSLFIAEATVVSRDGHGYPHTPGLYTKEQIEAWKPVVKAVKDKGAVFFSQLWHVGRASHQVYQEDGQLPVSCSAVAIQPDESMCWLGGAKMEAHPVPQALDKEGIKAKVQAFRTAARNAIEAGFDGVEIHAANGYLIDQFTKSSSNKRTDEYGGCIENRCRFALEIAQAVAEEVGADRVGIRLAPFTTVLGCRDDTPYATFTYLLEQLNKHGLAYVHVVEPRINGVTEVQTMATLKPFRAVFSGPFIAAGGHTRETGVRAVATGHADLVAYGRLWIATPDLPKRFLLNAPLNKYDRSTFYTHDNVGYLDYPFLEDEEEAKEN